jgi:hypothetical protein
MFPRSSRLALPVLLLILSGLFLSLPFIKSSAQTGPGNSRQRSLETGKNSGNQGPPNFDAFGASPKRPAAAANTQNNSQIQLSDGPRIVQTEPRLGVPTFLWAQVNAQGQTKQRSTAKVQAQSGSAQAQVDIESAARGHLGEYGSHYRLSAQDVAASRFVAMHDTGRGAIIAKFKQEVSGIEVFRDEINVIMDRNLQLVAISGYLTGDNKSDIISNQSFILQHSDALIKALSDLTGTTLDAAVLQSVKASASEASQSNVAGGTQNSYALFTGNKGIAPNFTFGEEPSRVKKILFHLADQYVPAYYIETSIQLPSVDRLSVLGEAITTEWAYSYVISAVDGQVLFRNNLIDDAGTPYTYRVWADPVTKIPYDSPAGNDPHPKLVAAPDGAQAIFSSQNDVTLANYPFIRNDPWLAPGATETVGNNVDAFVNLFTPDGYGPVTAPADPATGDFRAQITGPNAFLHLHTPDSSTLTTAEARQGAVQQLFYNVNFLHDWFYDAGFDEPAGNAQTDNYGRGGIGNDSMKAQAQDFSGRNNANMFTPADGARPRMRMYIFDTAAVKYVDVLSPAGIAGQRAVGAGQFGAQSFNLTNDVVQPIPVTGCTAASFTGLAGKFVLVDRQPTGGTGSCSIGTKLNNAMAAGAAGFILVNLSTTPTTLVTVTGSLPSFTIPFLAITWNSAAGIKTQLAAAQTVSARMRRDAGVDRDGSIDNQIVAHEWGHYITNRLIGNANGLSTTHAGGLGEGWGDFHAMMLTVRADDVNTPSNANWNGAYALATYATSGSGNNGYYYGIRRYPYSTDMNKNPLTFKHIHDGVALPTEIPVNQNGGLNSEVHNTGEVWTTMLWECYASLLRDSDRLNFAEAQERMKYYLVASYKMTPVDPTLLEARDALLAAAFAFDAADGQLFLQAFAKRGAGAGAVAPDRYSRDNSGVVESFTSGANLLFVGATLDDGVESCDNDGYLDNGEQGLLKVTIKNTGSQALNATTANVSSSNQGVTFPNGTTLNFPSTQSEQTVTGSLVVAGSSLAGVQGTDFTITIQDNNNTSPVNLTGHLLTHLNLDQVPAGSATDDVESNLSAWTIGGTSTTVITGTELILTKSYTAKWRRLATSESNSVWYGPNVGIGADQNITSPVMTVDGSGSVNLQFDHSFGFEFDGGGNYDGGVVEMTINGGAWSDMGASAYNGTLITYSGDVNPLKGRSAFVQNSGGNIHASITKAIAPGSTIQVRFRLGSDGAAGSTGWQLDNVAFSGVVETPFTQVIADAAVCQPAGPGPSSIQLSPAALPSGMITTAYTAQLVASNGTAPYVYSLTPYALPTGLVYDVVNGNLEITGTPTRLGNFPVTVVVNDSAGQQSHFNYTIVITRIPTTIVWADAANITYGTALSTPQLNATADVPGSFTYTPAAGTVLDAGSCQTLTVNFTPTDSAIYANASTTVIINVLKATAAITWANPADVVYGTPLSATQLDATASTPGSFTYTPAVGTVLNAGAGQTLSVFFTPTDMDNYTTATDSSTDSVQINVTKVTPTITWNNPSDIDSGTALTNTQLNPSASVPGTFIYTPPTGTVMTAGANQDLSVNFTPTDAANYNNASKTVSINVLKVTPTITWANPADIVYGASLSATQLNATSSTPGTFTYTPAAGTIFNSGVGQTLAVNFTPTDANNYNSATKSVQINVSKATPVITWNNPADLASGTVLSNTQLNASASVPGTLIYTPPAGTVLSSGTNQNLSVNFTPTDAANYNDASKHVTINVNASGTLQFNAAAYSVNENGGSATITITRTGDTAGAATVLFSASNGTATDADYTSVSQTVTFVDGDNIETVNIPISDDSINEPNETVNLTLSGAGGFGLLGTPAAATLSIIDDDTPLVQFSSATYTVAEDSVGTAEGFASLTVQVDRTGDASAPATVRYLTSDLSGTNECDVVNTGNASQRCDYTTVRGTLRFAAGETSKTFNVPVVKDGYVEGSEQFKIELQSASGATLGPASLTTVTITDNGAPATDGVHNPYLNDDFFVRMHYLDFLAREPEPRGFADWTSVLNGCGSEHGFLGAPAFCDRMHVSHGFFGATEFIDRGFLIHRLYEVGMDRLPLYAEFTPDMATLTSENLGAAAQRQNLEDHLQEFGSRPEFVKRFALVSAPDQAAQFIEKLEQTAGLTLPAAATDVIGRPQQYGRNDLIALRSGGLSLAETLKTFVEQQVVYDKYFPRGFVTMQYFAYLRRDPDTAGWNDWLDVILHGKASAGIAPGDYRHLIFGFVNSTEYRKRFGQP